jgi:hypothetical protein
MSGSYPFSANILKHIFSPKIVTNTNGGYDVKVDLVNVDNVTATGTIAGTSANIKNTRLSGFPTQSTFVTTDATGFRWLQGTNIFPNQPFTFINGKTYMITGNLNVSTTNANSSGIQVFLSTQDGITISNYVNSSNYQLYEYSSPGVQPRFGSTFSVVFTANSSSTTYGIFIRQTVTSGTSENATAYLTTFNITQLT